MHRTARAGLAKGAPDLVIWSEADTYVRFVEVKCPDWDRPYADRLLFHEAVRALASQCAIVADARRGREPAGGVIPGELLLEKADALNPFVR